MNTRMNARLEISLSHALSTPKTLIVLALCLLLPSALVASNGETGTGETSAGEALAQLDPELFPVPEVLKPNVEFWTTVYTGYDSNHRLLHDERYLNVVYAVIDFTRLNEAQISDSERYKLRRNEIRKAEAKYRQILLDLAAGRVSKDYPEDQARVERLFESVPGNRSKYSAATGRFRTQTCLRERFAEAVRISGLYMPHFEAIFASRGLPLELTRLPFVESMFQVRAHSSASAAGLWQFIRATAKYYIDMELEYDHRWDPLEATEGAAKLLERNYQQLKTWPLALTAYNHGEYGMKRAVRQVGTRDLGVISQKYRSRSFGFASRNFYSEFIAAAEIYANRTHYFPDVTPLPKLTFDTFVPEAYVAVKELSTRTSVSVKSLRELNPSLVRDIWSDGLYLPRNYALRVPKGKLAEFEAAYTKLPADALSTHQVGRQYRVRSGDTLGRIAARFGTSVGAIQRANSLRSANLIRKGQLLLIPPSRGGSTTGRVPRETPSTLPSTHVVRKGETLTGIARRYSLTVKDLRAANQLANANALRVGQTLKIPQGTTRRHTVRSGETLSSIAARYGTTVSRLRSANQLSGSLIRPSQVLVIP